jgi:hypothetical protein
MATQQGNSGIRASTLYIWLSNVFASMLHVFSPPIPSTAPGAGTFTESYTTFTLDPKIEPKMFELPK